MRIRFFEQDISVIAAVIGLAAAGPTLLLATLLASSSDAIEPPLQNDGGNDDAV